MKLRQAWPLGKTNGLGKGADLGHHAQRVGHRPALHAAGVDEAQKGKAESAKIPVPNRELFSNGATTLTVRAMPEDRAKIDVGSVTLDTAWRPD